MNQARPRRHYLEQLRSGGEVLDGLTNAGRKKFGPLCAMSSRSGGGDEWRQARMAVRDSLDTAELELLLPWHATGTLNEIDANSIERGLAAFPTLVRRFRQVQSERIDIVRAGNNLGAPSDRPFFRLLAAVGCSSASKRRTAEREAVVIGALAAARAPGSGGD